MLLLQGLAIGLLCFVAQSAAGNYDYAEVLTYSMLFYEAQRSGKLPNDQRVEWRKDSALNDRGDMGEDLSGGYYDAGDYVKFGFPMAYTITVLSWGAIEYRNGYEYAGLSNDIKEAIKWGTDYFLKAHSDETTLYGQVGNGEIDHAWWGRPEDMTMERPAYKITAYNAGSELAGETAAALAAASIVFKDTDSKYSAELLQHAKQLFELANTHRVSYVQSIPDVANFYNSFNGFNDEIVWAAAWIAKATGDWNDVETASSLYREFGMANSWTLNFSWDDKTAGIEALMAELTNDQNHNNKLISYVQDVMYSRSKTPRGLVFIDEWGTLRHAANAAFIAMRAVDLGIGSDDMSNFAKTQIGYMLGDTGRSFVIGYGENYPTHPHHRSSSCPDAPAPCGWDNYNSNEPNPQLLYGALVGGPDRNDQYTDARSDYQHNEVACDYNAAFSGVLAAFVQHGF